MYLPTPARVALVFLASCGGESVGDGGGKTSSSSTEAREKEEKAVPAGYCIDTFQVGLADASGHAMVRVCLISDIETESYIRKHRKYHVGIKTNCESIISSNGLGELEMPGARERIRQEMHMAVTEQIKPLIVTELRIERWELW